MISPLMINTLNGFERGCGSLNKPNLCHLVITLYLQSQFEAVFLWIYIVFLLKSRKAGAYVKKNDCILYYNINCNFSKYFCVYDCLCAVRFYEQHD